MYLWRSLLLCLSCSTFLFSLQASEFIEKEERVRVSFKRSSEFQLANELIIHIFSYLPMPNLLTCSQVCKTWETLSEEPMLWKQICLIIYGDYPLERASKENAKYHWLRIYVNTLSDPIQMADIIYKHNLNTDHPFQKYRRLLPFETKELINEQVALADKKALINFGKMRFNYYNNYIYYDYEEDPKTTIGIIESLVQHGNQEAIRIKLYGLIFGEYGYKKNTESAIDFARDLIKEGHQKAISQKELCWLELGAKSYNGQEYPNNFVALLENLVEEGHKAVIAWTIGSLMVELGEEEGSRAAVAFNEKIALQGNQTAINIKIQGLAKGKNGYPKNPEAAVAFNETLVERGDEKAIKRKLKGLEEGKYGYVRNRKATVAFNEILIKQGNQKAIKRKLTGLTYGKYGYIENPREAFVFNETLVERGDEKAIKRRLFKFSPVLQSEGGDQMWLNETLVEKGDKKAIKRKLLGLTFSHYGYVANYEAAIAFIEGLIKQGNKKAIRLKLKGLTYGRYGYLKNTTELKAWIEAEAVKGARWAYYCTAIGLKHGIFGFTIDHDKAVEYIKFYKIPY
ncbi:F-box protein [Candidatus Odyssella acanthamoebae]|uniref:F-box protein n=1 Tax=Candidatus Odyssella acanthamoebae TaxID=91604 RepID=UPI0009FD73F2|nr:F-box protein [Candidatus Paracaedibacter acanthamoebae]